MYCHLNKLFIIKIKDISHVILKHKDKKGTFIPLKAPEISIEVEIDSDPILASKSKSASRTTER